MKLTLCDCLIDQGRKIGGDPVGYKCCNQAQYVAFEVNFCKYCREMLEKQPSCIMFYLPKRYEAGFKNNKIMLSAMKILENK
jgi:hypothetical protein